MRFPTGRHRFIPRLTALDERALPSVTVGPVDAGGSLVIRGDRHANTIAIVDDGAGNVTVTADGVASPIIAGVSFIKVYGGNGADNVTYTLQGDLSSVRGVFVNLGNQSDTFLASLQGNLLDGGSLSLVVQGGNGNDDISVDAANVINAGANLTAVLQGGNGSDSLAIDYTGVLAGSATLAANGGNGKDTVSGNVALSSTTDSGTTTTSNGRLTLDFEGGNAPDKLTLNLSGEADLSAPPTIQFNGGRGKDLFTHSDNVTPADDGHGKKH